MKIGVLCNLIFTVAFAKPHSLTGPLDTMLLVDFFSISYPKYSLDYLLDIQPNVNALEIKIVHIRVNVLWDKIPHVS